MEKKNKIALVLIAIITLIVIFICVLSISKKETIETSDAIRFKEEYESLNGMFSESEEKIYTNVEISLENPIIYKTDEEIIDVIHNESAIIYFGFKNCPWCRNMIETLLKAAKDQKLQTIYYVNISNIRDDFIINNEGKIEKIKDGTESYKKILEFLGKNLSNYYIRDDEEELHNTNTTRLIAPTVIAVKNGQLQSIHEGTLEDQDDPYKELNSEQLDELYQIYVELIDTIADKNVCETSNSC